MKKRAGNFLLGGSILFAAVVCATVGARHFHASTTTEHTTMNDSNHEMINALAANGANPSLGDEAETFGRFVGTWDCDYVNFEDDGTASRTRGEVIFGWILEGRAIQDIWVWTDADDPDWERKQGTTLRFFNARTRKWQIVWIQLDEGLVKTLTGGAVGDRIVLEGTAPDGAAIRWSFNEIQGDSFVWRGERSRDQGKTWRLTGEYQLRRRVAGKNP